MQLFSEWSERQSQITRWILVVGWMMLIVSLLFGLDPYPFDVNRCAGSSECHAHEGNQIFWGMVVPAGLFTLVVLSHEVWRRICPLAFVSQLFRALGWQRTVVGKGGRRVVAKVEAGSWLGRHHVQLQWTLLIAGLCLRLLVVNSSTLGLGLLLLATLLAALVVGWAYGGKARCHYICPMAPVQTVVTGPRSFFGSPAHLEATSKVTQSMCRSIGENGRIQSACVACQAPCLDIDSERAYWQTLSGKRGLNEAWWSYPGLVIAFFLLIKDESRGSLDYLRSGMWAYDKECIHYIMEPLGDGWWTLGLPRLVSIPALLTLSAWISIWFFSWWKRVQENMLIPELGARAADIAINRTRLLATFVAVNSFFWFADPSIGLLGPAGGQGIRSLVLIVSGMWFQRGWHRDIGTYTRESTSASLRKQLEKLGHDLSPYLAGRSLKELSHNEIFTLAKALPVQVMETRRSIYKEVMFELFRTGRLDRAAALVQLEELRESLQLVAEDHYAAIRELAVQDPRILQLDALQRERRTLRQEASAEAITELLRTTRNVDLNALLADPEDVERLDQIRVDFGLDQAGWDELLSEFGPASDYARQRLSGELELLKGQLASRRALELAAEREPLLRPLLLVMDRRITSILVTIGPALQAFPGDDPLWGQLATLRVHVPVSIRSQVGRQYLEGGVSLLQQKQTPLEPFPDPADVIDELWRDPDPDTALWALWVQRQRSPERGEALRRQPRIGLTGSPSIERLLRGEAIEGADLMERLLTVPLVAGLSPAALFNVVRFSKPLRLEPGEPLFQAGDQSGVVAILLEGSCDVVRRGGHGLAAISMARVSAGEPIGEVTFFTEQAYLVDVIAGEKPVEALIFSRSRFEQLLQQSSEFSRSLLRQMAWRIEALYARAGSAVEAA